MPGSQKTNSIVSRALTNASRLFTSAESTIDNMNNGIDAIITPIRGAQSLGDFNPAAHPVVSPAVVATGIGFGISQILFGSSEKSYRSKLNTVLKKENKNLYFDDKLQHDRDSLNSLCGKMQLDYEFIIETTPSEDGSELPQAVDPTKPNPHKHLRLVRSTKPSTKPKYSFKNPEAKLNGFENFVRNVVESRVFQFIFTPPWKAATGKAAMLYWVLWFCAVLIASPIVGIATTTTLAGGLVGLATLSGPALLILGLPLLYGLLSMVRDYWQIIKKVYAEHKNLEDDKNISLSDVTNREPKPDIIQDENEKELVFRTLYKAMQVEREAEQIKRQLKENHAKQFSPFWHIKNNLSAKPASIKIKDIEEPKQWVQPNKHVQRLGIAWESVKGGINGYVYGFFAAWITLSAPAAILAKVGMIAVASALIGGPIGIGIMTGLALACFVGFAIYAGVKASQAVKQEEKFRQENKEFLTKGKDYKVEKTKLLKNIGPYNENKLSEKSKSDIAKKHALSGFEYFTVLLSSAGTGSFLPRSLLIGGAIALIAAIAHPGVIFTGPVVLGLVVGCAAIWGIARLASHIYEKQKKKNEMKEKTDPIIQEYELEKLKEVEKYKQELESRHANSTVSNRASVRSQDISELISQQSESSVQRSRYYEEEKNTVCGSRAKMLGKWGITPSEKSHPVSSGMRPTVVCNR